MFSEISVYLICFSNLHARVQYYGQGRGGGASGRVMAFCPSGPGSSHGGAPGSNLGLFILDVVNLFSLGVGHFTYQ